MKMRVLFAALLLSATAVLNAQEAKYEIKSATIKKVMVAMGQTLQMTVWIWKGLVLKSETASNGMVVMVETATQIDESSTVSADKFIVPEEIKLPE